MSFVRSRWLNAPKRALSAAAISARRPCGACPSARAPTASIASTSAHRLVFIADSPDEVNTAPALGGGRELLECADQHVELLRRGEELWRDPDAVHVCRVDRHREYLLYTSDAADERSSVDLGGRRIIKKKKKK